MLAVLVLLAGAVVAWNHEALKHIFDGASIPAATADDVLEIIATRPESAALATWEIGDTEHGIFLNADRPQPLASTVKVVMLLEYAEQLDPAEPVELTAWEKFYLPDTDGGAHPDSLAELGRRSAYSARDLAYAMIRHSDNAAFDWFIFRLGHNRGAPHPLSGQFIACNEAATAERADEDAWREAVGRRDGTSTRRLTASVRLQLQCAKTIDNRGTARDYAKLMERAVTGDGLAHAAHVRELLEWPMQKFADNRETFDAFGAKGGSLPGVLTNAAYGKTKGGRSTRVFALFLQDLPFGLYLNLSSTYAHQHFQRRVLTDAAFVEKLRARLR